MAKFSEFIFFDEKYDGTSGDFSGTEEAIGAEERVKFLQAYSDHLKKKYGLENGSKKVVSDEETAKKLSEASYMIDCGERETVYFDGMRASVKNFFSAYKGWRFYTDRVRVENGELILNDGWTPPVPCAKYALANGRKLKKLNLSVYISKSYRVREKTEDSEKPPHDTATGRIVEIRDGLAELVKIQFYADGRAFACVGIPDRYHHTKIFLGNYQFERWNELEIVFKGDTFDCSLNGETAFDLSFTDKGTPDTLFLSGGMHAVDFWKVRPVGTVYEDDAQSEFFVSEEETDAEEKEIGEVRLPFGVGGYENRDKILILRKEFDRVENKKALLTIDTLDPGGEVRINGKTVCRTDGFMKQVHGIDGFLRDGKNLLEIFVFPRAPEKLYCWHRCNDTYNAWLCGKARIDFVSNVHVTSLRIVTERVTPRVRTKFEIGLNQEYRGRVRIFLKKSNPDSGEEREIFAGLWQGKSASIPLEPDVEAWTPEYPALYFVRVRLEDENGGFLDDYVEETGFRTIGQKNGDILLNGKKICLKGALIMQFLAPYENVLKSHTCPTDREIVWQIAALKKMNANVARLHILGYGTNDERFARFCDRIGLMLIWTTRFIDSVESVKWGGEWKQKDGYLQQMREVINHPSIVMWEGSNEFHAEREEQDALYDQFVSAIKSVDQTRLICPCSHLYYGGGLYGNEGFYYQDDGKADQDFQAAESSYGWKDPLVVRSAHTYDIMLGYGSDWGTFRKQGWKSEKSLFESKKHAYIVSEIAVIGRHDDTTKECATYVKNDSYELSNEDAALGVHLEQKDWRISQAYQALAAQHTVKSLLARNTDGVMWCCLSGGANDGSYLKPPIDFYGYAKYAFYSLQEGFAEEICFNRSTAVVFGENSVFEPTLAQIENNENYEVKICVKKTSGEMVDEYGYVHCATGSDVAFLPKWKPRITDGGYYIVEYRVRRVKKEERSR